MAENYRTLYLAAATAAATGGSEEAQRLASRIWLKLFGVQPTGKD